MPDVSEGPASSISVHVHEKEVVVTCGDMDGYSAPVPFCYRKRGRVKMGLDIASGKGEDSETLCPGYSVRGNDH